MSVSLPVKCHLPLITTRIEFQFNVLSPHPQITLRRDLGAVIRRQARRATPYTRLNPRGVAVTAHRTAHRAESPLTDMDSDDSDGESEQIMQSHKILKPKGEAGKSNSGGYNLQDAMGWEDKEFTTFTVSQVTHTLRKSPKYLNRNTSMSKSKRNLTTRYATVSRSPKTWKKSFNQYEFGYVSDVFLLPYNLGSKTIRDTRQVLR
jgi:hypothetical protein